MIKQKQLVPKRRFEGFKETWKNKKFGQLYDIKSGNAFNRSEYVATGVPIINGESIHYGRINMKNLNFLPKEYVEKYSNYKIIPEDIVLGLNRPIINNRLKIAQVPKELKKSLLYQRAGKVEFLKAIDIDFTYHLLGNEIYKFVLKEAVGSDQPFISTTILKDWDLSIPKIEKEQQKIGQFFKHLDEMITLEQRKIDKTKALKSAYLAEMFPSEGERVPKRRFEGFTDEWKERSFDEEIELYRGLTYSPNDVKQKGTFVLRSSNVQNGEIVNADNVYVDSGVVNSNNVREGDIIVVVRNGSRSLIGKHAQVKVKMDKTVIGAFMTGIRSHQSNFINALLDTQNFKNEVDKNLGATINQITDGMFRGMNFLFPTNKEQQKIGSFFKNIDDTIRIQQQKTDKLKAKKQAYLHEMFV